MRFFFPPSLFFISNLSFLSASFSLYFHPPFLLSSFSQHRKSPQNVLLAFTPASAAGYFGPPSHLTAESSSVWLQEKSSLWKAPHTLFSFEGENGSFYVMLNMVSLSFILASASLQKAEIYTHLISSVHIRLNKP